jgi:ABC-type lipoprotein export system ATPase subunit/predicted  nucleic acid-binding Zn-ribbon protein
MKDIGAQWNKWDLHVHAPSKFTCAKNDKFIGTDLREKQSKFIEELKNVKDHKVIGITDYFSLDGYKMVMEHSKDLAHFDLIIPNIELRITPVTTKNRKINLHIIPNTEVLSIEEIERLLYNFDFGPDKFTCTENDLIALGKRTGVLSSDEEAFVKGLNEFAISYDTFFKVFDSQPKKVKENVLIGVSNNSNDGASGIKDIQGIRDIIYYGVNFIFSAQESDRKYFSGKGSDNVEFIIKKYGSIKSCIHGSDYHGSRDGKTICIPDLNRYCWIKASPTFKGLQQAILEFENRIFIGDKPEVLKRFDSSKYDFINKIEIDFIEGKTTTEEWFRKKTLFFNKELTAIIGNKGQGKSAITDIIGLAGASSKQEKFSFLNTKRFLAHKDSQAYKCRLTFGDNTNSEWRNFTDKIDASENERITYLPQSYIESICAEEGDQFEKVIKEIIFSYLPPEDRLGTESFDQFTNAIEDPITKSIQNIKEILRDKIDTLLDKERKKKKAYIDSLNNQRTELVKKLHALNEPEEVKNPNTKNDEEMASEKNNIIDDLKLRINKIENTTSNNKYEIEKVNNNVNKLESLKSEIEIIKSDFDKIVNKYSGFLNEQYRINFKDIANLTIKSDSLLKQIVGCKKCVEKVKEINSSLDHEKESINKQISDIEAKLSSEQKKYNDYKKNLEIYTKTKSNFMTNIQKLNDDINYISSELDREISEIQNDIIDLSKSIFKKNKDLIARNQKVFEPIKAKIDLWKKEIPVLNKYDLNFESNIQLKDKLEENILDEFISSGVSGTFCGKDNAISQLKKRISYDDPISENSLEKFLRSILEALYKDLRNESNETPIDNIESQFKRSDGLSKQRDFYFYLFSCSFLKSVTEITSNAKSLKKLSPGEKGAVLLVVYLLLDKTSHTLVIDQPEENLDNQSVYEVLRPFILKAKKKRQVIIVTHNPNIAVTCDAEQIIVVHIDKENKNKFSFVSGSIENTEINNEVAAILEGTMPAFNNRKNKYFKK